MQIWVDADACPGGIMKLLYRDALLSVTTSGSFVREFLPL